MIKVEDISFQRQSYRKSLKFQQQNLPCNHYKSVTGHDTRGVTLYMCNECNTELDQFDIARISEDLRKKYNKELKINYV